MYWKCRSGIRSEDDTLDEQENKGSLNLFTHVHGTYDNDVSNPREATTTLWTWVADYTTRDLTRSEDRVAAMTGMLRYFERLTGDTPMLGLWKSSFMSDLLWTVTSPVTDTPSPGLPSWSWFSRYQQPILHQLHDRWFDREHNTFESYLESFDVEWTGSPFTSKLHSSTLRLSGVFLPFEIQKDKYKQSLHVTHPSCPGYSGEVEYTLDDGSELLEGDIIRCLFLFYSTEHIDTEGPMGETMYESRRWEHFLLITAHESPVTSALELWNPPEVYRRFGVGSFQLDLVPQDEWRELGGGIYGNTSWPNPPLMFDGAERTSFELV